jgi:hypothetical protein
VAKDFAIYKVYIHKVKQRELYELLESMPKSIRGLHIREALEHFRLIRGETGHQSNTHVISLQGAFENDFGEKV